MAAIKDLTKDYERDEIITIALENTDENLQVSKALLCGSSEYFKKALQGEWKEAGERTLTVPGCDIDTFRLFRHWRVRGSLPSNLGNLQVQMVRLWVFADSVLMPKVQNAAMQMLCEHLNMEPPALEAIEQVWKLAAEGSKLRQAFVTSIAIDWKLKTISDEKLQEIAVKVPEVVPDFARHLMYCPGEWCEHNEYCYPSDSDEGNRVQFMVEVDTSESKQSW